MKGLCSINRLLFALATGFLLSTIFGSCGTTRPFVYMQGQFDTAKLSQITVTDPIIQKGDLLSIIVYSDDPLATQLYNQALVAVSSASVAGGAATSGIQQSVTGISPTTPGYLVDENGNIEFQQLGLMHIVGMTRSEVKDTLDLLLQKYMKHPYCTVRFLNYRFTMLGEILKPAIYSIPSDHINIFEALALAGDMTLYARRDNVLIIREKDGKREFGRIDLTKPEVMGSPYFYLQQNDIVYIEQNRKKSVANDAVTSRNISIATAIVSILVVIYSIFRD
jgi:polysaccharide biosynthesis/export protein